MRNLHGADAKPRLSMRSVHRANTQMAFTPSTRGSVVSVARPRSMTR